MLKLIYLFLVIITQIAVVLGSAAAMGLSDTSGARITLVALIFDVIFSFFIYKTIYKKFINNLVAYPWYWKVVIISSPLWITLVVGILLIFIGEVL